MSKEVNIIVEEATLRKLDELLLLKKNCASHRETKLLFLGVDSAAAGGGRRLLGDHLITGERRSDRARACQVFCDFFHLKTLEVVGNEARQPIVSTLHAIPLTLASA